MVGCVKLNNRFPATAGCPSWLKWMVSEDSALPIEIPGPQQQLLRLWVKEGVDQGWEDQRGFPMKQGVLTHRRVPAVE